MSYRIFFSKFVLLYICVCDLWHDLHYLFYIPPLLPASSSRGCLAPSSASPKVPLANLYVSTKPPLLIQLQRNPPFQFLEKKLVITFTCYFLSIIYYHQTRQCLFCLPLQHLFIQIYTLNAYMCQTLSYALGIEQNGRKTKISSFLELIF